MACSLDAARESVSPASRVHEAMSCHFLNRISFFPSSPVAVRCTRESKQLLFEVSNIAEHAVRLAWGDIVT
jgi:hypothetical protein